MTFAEKVLVFLQNLEYTGHLPAGIQIMDPFRNNPEIEPITREFYTKFFSDNKHRWIILGINPGRFGAGVTGIPFTDTIRLNEKCGIPFNGFRTYEPSSVFIYDMIDKYGGVHDFFKKFFVSALCPLGFTRINSKGKTVNYNYYDSRELASAAKGFILSTLKQQLEFGISRSVCFCLGTGKNEQLLRYLNDEYHFFKKIIALEHPRYIMQYRARFRQVYIDKYLATFNHLSTPAFPME